MVFLGRVALGRSCHEDPAFADLGHSHPVWRADGRIPGPASIARHTDDSAARAIESRTFAGPTRGDDLTVRVEGRGAHDLTCVATGLSENRRREGSAAVVA